MEQEIKCTQNKLFDDTTEVTTDDSMTSSHYCFGLRTKSHDIHEGKSKSLSRNPLGSSTSISMQLAWPKRVGSRKKSNTCIEFEEKSEYVIKKQSLTDVTNDNKCRKETDTHKERFLRFFRIGFTNKSKKQKTDMINVETSPFDAIRNVSAKHSHFAKYLALEDSVNQSLTYLPSTVKMSLQWPEQEKLDTFDPNETQNLPLCPTEGVNSEEDKYKNICTNVMIRPPKCGQRSSSAVQSDRFSEISSDKNIESCSINEKIYPPTPITSKSTALLRRPRTPTLGRAALFVRASYMGVDKPGTPSSLSFCKQSTKRDTIASNDSRLFDFPNLSSAQSGFISRSSSINCELRELNQNSQQSFNQLSIQNNSSQSNLHSFISNRRQNETKIPKAISNRHHCHAYDTVPLDKLECLKLIPSVQMLNKSSDANSELSNVTLLKSSSRVPATVSCLNGCQKLQSPSTDYCTKQNEVDKIKTDVWKDTKHSDNVSTISLSETETSLQDHKRSAKCPATLMKGESNQTFEVTSLQQDSHSSSKSCDNILNSRKSVEIPKASVQPMRQKSTKTNVGVDLPTSPKSRNPQKSSHSFYLKQNKNSEKKRCESINMTGPSTEITMNKQSLECTKQSQSEKQINHSVNVGSIVLRRRAKPELENEQHRDVSLRISIQEVKNLSAKGRYFCEICLDRTLYARTTSKLSDGTVFWGEQFDMNNLPSISIMTINLFRQATFVKDKRQRNKNQNQFIGM
ncbi:putative Ras GTPase-activating protein isoform 3 [Schistosoma japonicum]|uniref:Putative Ras GTPase-activating protein isoform 3 n=2 Tax=Schistosoma japonicum TaxID=6182 RepID=A0A4Z2DG10_SCHJA|nr:putative Ras GTPase-activating protein isoform 3 [Schistosoma japonicum]